MFYELIDKIVVYEAEGVSRARTQKVDIYFNYVGQVNIDYTPEEVAEIQAQEAQTAAERLQKQRAREKACREKRKAERLAANGGEFVKSRFAPNAARYLYQPAVTKPFVQRDAATKHGRIRSKPNAKPSAGSIITANAFALCAAAPTGPKAVGQSFVPMLAGKRTTIK
ncbi:DUF4368 domain-containing protein [Gemmiger formicilis]|nr:DUF4368 domain-containing protein [Gemmiger formicilis]